ncbi:MAG: cytochrome c oxidase assembly protein [Chloroflexota bacterium]
MDPITRAVLQSWNWQIEVIVVLVLMCTLYTRGWFRLRQRTRAKLRNLPIEKQRYRLAVRWRLISYWAGLLLVALALISPIDPLGQQLFFFHMIQHLLLIMFAPPLLLIANPMPFVLWGLPNPLRIRFGWFLAWLLRKDAPFRRGLLFVTNPGVLWMLWVIALFAWHDPGLYNAALEIEWVHQAEHLTFFLTSMLLWWNVTNARPRIRKKISLLARIGLLIAAVPPNMLLGVILSFAQPVYSYYETVPRLWNIGLQADQQIGGVIMWVPGSMMYVIAALILIARLLSGEEQQKLTRRSTPPIQKEKAADGTA